MYSSMKWRGVENVTSTLFGFDSRLTLDFLLWFRQSSLSRKVNTAFT